MVTAHFKRRVDLVKKEFIGYDGSGRCGHAVVDFVEVYDGAAKNFGDGLLAQTNTEDAFGFGVGPDDVLEQARFIWDAWSGRKQDLVERCDFAEVEFVVAVHGDLGTNVFEIVDEVVGETVVVVYDEDFQGNCEL